MQCQCCGKMLSTANIKVGFTNFSLRANDLSVWLTGCIFTLTWHWQNLFGILKFFLIQYYCSGSDGPLSCSTFYSESRARPATCHGRVGPSAESLFWFLPWYDDMSSKNCTLSLSVIVTNFGIEFQSGWHWDRICYVYYSLPSRVPLVQVKSSWLQGPFMIYISRRRRLLNS